MKYYKLIKNHTFIGVSTSMNFIRYQKRNHLYVSANETTGEFIECNGCLYHSSWMPPVPNEAKHPFEQAVIIEITEEEYNIYYKAQEKNEEIIIEDKNEYIPPILIDNNPIEEASIEFIRSSKINETSYQCNKIIENGFDLELRGATHHFSLTTQDQLNLMSLGTMAQTSNEIPYHADGEEVIFYTSEEINQIITAANAFKTYQTTYYNSLKAYINSLETIEEISAIEYGIEIPEKFKTEVLKALEHK